MPLTSARFAGDERLERCLAGDFSARLTPNTNGPFVALVQQALIDLGESLPQFGADGAYGDETVAAVLSYKTRHDIRTPAGVLDGIVGPLTIAKLDEECTALDQTPGPCPPDADGPMVDLGGQDERVVNVVLANVMAARIVGVSENGATRLLTGAVDGAEALAAAMADAAAALLAPNRPDALGSLMGTLSALAEMYAHAGETETAAALAGGTAWVPFADPGPALADFIIQQLANTVVGSGTPVRDLTKTSALTQAASHHALGDVVLSPAPAAATDPKAKFTIGPVVANVTFKVTMVVDRRLPSYKPVAAPITGMDIRHVVGTIRFAKHVASTWGVTEVHHIGWGADAGRTDCHGQGRAADLVGVAGARGGAPFLLTVFNDWKNHSVPNLDDRTKPRRPDWPEVTRQLEYRLLTDPSADPFARDFFADLYAWVASEYQDRTEGPNQVDLPSAIGQGSRIMTPDHPDSRPLRSKNGRQAHHSHVHWQVGPTGSQAP